MRHYNGTNVFGTHSWSRRIGDKWREFFDLYGGGTTSSLAVAEVDDLKRAEAIGQAFSAGAIATYRKHNAALRPKDK